MSHVTYDLDVLRSFSTGIALGSYARAADKLGRSTSAVSAQLRKLESQAGTPLLRKAGRGLELTEAGETMLAYAHRLLELNDEAVAAVNGSSLQGLVRVGLQEDLGEAVLPAALGRFARAHPGVRIEACVARSAELRERLELGRLDMAFAWEVGRDDSPLQAERVLRLPLQWIGPAAPSSLDAPWWTPQARRSPRSARPPLPLVLLDAPCPLRDIVTATLERAGIAWRHAFNSASLGALWAATSAGLGLSVRTTLGLPAHVRTIDRAASGLPALPQVALALWRRPGEPEPAAGRLAALLADAIRGAGAGAVA
ncbi:MAG: LysR substrate-binding domain-containing protein [Burkholderiaceae bacterium]